MLIYKYFYFSCACANNINLYFLIIKKKEKAQYLLSKIKKQVIYL